MFCKNQFGIVFNTLFSFAFALLLTAFALFQQGALTPGTLIMGFIPAFGISFTLGSYIPLVEIGSRFAGIFLKDEKHPVFYLLRLLAIAFVMTASMSFLVMFSQMGFTMDFLMAFLFSFPATFLFAYVVAVIIFPFLFSLTSRWCVK